MLAIGKVAKPQGLKGEMKILPFGDSELFLAKSVFIENTEFEVEQIAERPNGLFLKLVGVDSIEKANALKNKEIQIPLAVAREILGEDKFLWQDLFGKQIVAGGKIVGTIDSIDNFGSADIVFASHQGKQFSFPIVKGLVVEILDQLIVDEKRFGEVVCYED